MKDVMKYKGYLGSIEVSFKDDILFGKVLFVNDLITFQATSPTELEKEFKESVDIYIETCKEIGVEPKKSFTGNLNIRIDTETHEALAYKSIENECSINSMISEALDSYVKVAPIKEVVHNHHHTITYISEYDFTKSSKTDFEKAHLTLVKH